jgi:hypothetical protein
MIAEKAKFPINWRLIEEPLGDGRFLLVLKVD